MKCKSHVDQDDPVAYMEQEKQDFKLLTTYLNSYKNKLNITQSTGSTVFKPRPTIFTIEPKEDKEDDMALTLEQLNKHAKLEKGDLTLDYELYNKIKS